MQEDNVVPFNIKKKYKNYNDLSNEECILNNGNLTPIFESIFVDKYENMVGITKFGKQVLILWK